MSALSWSEHGLSREAERVTGVGLGASFRRRAEAGEADPIDTLWRRVQQVRAGERLSPRTAKLITGGMRKMAQKLIEEAAETGIEAVRGDRGAILNESVDLIYNLVVLWTEAGLRPEEIWAEMNRRDRTLGMAEKLPKNGAE